MEDKTFPIFFEFLQNFFEYSVVLHETRCNTAIYFDTSQKKT